MQDADYCVTLFKREAADSEFPWTYLGKHRAHYKPIRGLTFGLKLDTTAPRLLSVGEDRSLVSVIQNHNTFASIEVLTLKQGLIFVNVYFTILAHWVSNKVSSRLITGLRGSCKLIGYFGHFMKNYFLC